jgi:hypothetical protein
MGMVLFEVKPGMAGLLLRRKLGQDQGNQNALGAT